MNYKAIIFDFNGTLFFDNDKHVLAWGKISKLIRGRGISDEELHEQFNGTPNAKNIQYMMNNQATSEELKKYSLLKEEYYREFCKQDKASFHLVDGAVAFFDKLNWEFLLRLLVLQLKKILIFLLNHLIWISGLTLK